MFSRILSVTLCLSLLVPVGQASQAVQPDEPETTAAKTQTATQTETASPQPLSQDEEASLSARAEEPGAEVAGGALSNLHLTYAVIALAAIALVLLVK